MNMHSILYGILMYVWQLPQNILGLLFRLFVVNGLKADIDGITIIYSAGFKGGISLGNTIILGSQRPFSAHHEYGHQLQSKLLGPLYLIVIGIPSLTWAFLHSTFRCFAKMDYYSFFTERWANRLAGLQN